MLDPVTEMKAKASASGVSLSAACKKAGVDRSIPERWKKNVPKSFITYANIMQAIDDLAKEQESK